MSEQPQSSLAPNPAKRLRYLLLYLLMVWAVISLGFRFVLQDVPDYQQQLEKLVREKTDFQLDIGEMSGRWLLVSPVIELRDISIKGKAVNENQEQVQGISLAHVAVELDLIESLFTLSPRVKRILVDGVTGEFKFDEETGKLIVEGLPLKANEQAADKPEQLKSILDNYIFTAEQIYLRNLKFGFDGGKHGVYQVEVPSLTLDNEWFNHQLESRLLIAMNEEKPRRIDFVSVFQGNPLEFDSFSARSFLSLDRNELSYLFEHELWPKNQFVQPKNARLGLKSWIQINRGVLESIKLDFSMKDILFAYQLKEEKSEQAVDIKPVHTDIQDVSIDELSFKMELKGGISLEKLVDIENRNEYLKTLKYSALQLQVKDFEFVWGDFAWRNLAILLEQGVSTHLSQPLSREWSEFYLEDSKEAAKGESRVFARLLINRIPVSLVGKVMPYVPLDADKKTKIMNAAPEGNIHQLQVFAYEPLSENREIYASTYVNDLGISAFDKLPGVHGVDFYAEYAPNVLGVELQTINALLEENFYLFRKDLDIAELSGNLLLEKIPGDIVISSDVVELQANNISAQGRFNANIPDRLYETGEKEQPAWSLQAHLKSTPLEDIKMFFLGKLPISLLDWVDGFLKKGKVEGDIFLFAFLKRHDPYTFTTLDANLDVHEASLDYLPGRWPQIDEVEASVLVHNDKIKADVSSAKMFDSRLFNGSVLIESYLKENLPRVQVSAQSSGSLGDVQKLFLQSELKETLGHVVEDWVLTGNQQSDLQLDFPLSNEPGQKKEEIDVNLKTEDALLAIPSVRLGVKSLSTDLHYSLKDGLRAESLKALFFDKQIEGKIETHEGAGEQVIQISGKGNLSSDDLKSWQSFWLFDNLSGDTDFEASISIGDLEAVNTLLPELGVPTTKDGRLPLSGDIYKGKESIVRVEVKTDLKNTAIVLPGNYGKKTNVSMPSTLQLDVFPEWLIYRMNYGKRVGVVAKTTGEEGDFNRARIHFGDGFFPLPAETGLVVTGYIDHVDFDEWTQYIEKNLMDDVSTEQTSEPEVLSKKVEEDPAAIINRIDVSVERFTGFGEELDNLDAFVTREPFKWRISLENKMLKGVVLVPDEELISRENPVVAKLDYLRISEEQLEGVEYQEVAVKGASGDGKRSEKVVVKKEVVPYVPSDFMFAQIDIANVTLGSLKNGRWRIDLMPDEQGMDFNVHQLNYGLMTINGTGRWDYSEERSVTYFKGHLRTAAATKLFSALNLKPSAKSSGLMAIDIKWPGSPMDFDYEAMTGKAGLEIFDGSIVELDIKSKKFKALGIFNLGIVTDILTLKIFRKIGKGIDEALTGSEQEDK